MTAPITPFAFGSRVLDLATPQVMGILNITPDSFSDGGELLHAGAPALDAIRRRAETMVAAGASLLDVGGESTRPGATPVSLQEELDRVLPVLEALRDLDAVLSVDTSTPELMRACAAYGAGLINDVRALERPGALAAAAASGLPVCLMHRQGEPATMQVAPSYDDVVTEVVEFLQRRVEACIAVGIDRSRLLVDPGFGFGKTLGHNLRLLKQLAVLSSLQLPILIGLSRKRMLGAVTGRPEKERVVAGVVAAVLAVQQGACIVRTHDVAETVDAMKLLCAIREQE